jgi:hypothetical protein
MLFFAHFSNFFCNKKPLFPSEILITILSFFHQPKKEKKNREEIKEKLFGIFLFFFLAMDMKRVKNV